MNRNKIKNKNGITLIALVVTIIVLLILAGISIQMLTGENGILNRAAEAKTNTGRAQIIEQARLDIVSLQSKNLTDSISEKDLKEILGKYGTLSEEEEKIEDKTLTSGDGVYTIPVSEIYSGRIEKTVPQKPTVKDIEKSVYYGQQIDYDVDLGKNADGNNINIVGTADYDWEIFYYDGTNIYIIAEDYVPLADTNGLMPTTMNNTVDSRYPYNLYWPYNYGNIQNGKTGVSDIFGSGAPSGTSSLANKFLSTWKATMTRDGATTTLSGDKENKNSNARMTATLMDTSLWEKFANSTKVKGLTNETGELVAIGGPTLEMWVASWNDKYESTIKLFTNVKSDGTGYYVGTAEGTTDTYESVSNSDNLFFPRTSDYKECTGYWLASPSAYNADLELLVGFYGLVDRHRLRR